MSLLLVLPYFVIAGLLLGRFARVAWEWEQEEFPLTGSPRRAVIEGFLCSLVWPIVVLFWFIGKTASWLADRLGITDDRPKRGNR